MKFDPNRNKVENDCEKPQAKLRAFCTPFTQTDDSQRKMDTVGKKLQGVYAFSNVARKRVPL